ncbi:ABC transporter [Fusarium globosum]|uniref:ABC transporter n=1 Tax=Fusarium globosum TaxID=78864 RepID=A0A8H5XZ61_9HYPO|nr:ABC transporter [Fusarium globosum]
MGSKEKQDKTGQNDGPLDTTSTTEKEPQTWPYARIFKFGGIFEHSMQAVAIFAAICSGAGIALQNLIFGRFITVVIDFASAKTSPSHLRDEAATLALYFVYLGIGRFVLSYAYNTLLTYAAYRLTRNIRHAYLRAALSQEVAFFDLGTSGSIAAQASPNGRLIQGGISEKLGLLFQGISTLVTAFIIAFIFQWKLTLICLCIAPATLIINGAAAGIMAGHETNILEIHSQANSFAENILSSARTIHAFEMRDRLVRKFNTYLTDAHHVGNKISPHFGTLLSAEYCIVYLGYGLAFWQGIRMFSKGEIDQPGEIFTTGKIPSETIGEISVDNVTFAYPTRPGIAVLDNYSVKFPAGKTTALVGQSGSGKSTVIGLLERWYNPESGTISLDGCPIDQLNLNWLRTNVRLVQQEPVLFQGTIFDNIRSGLTGTAWEDAPIDEQMHHVEEAAKLAFAHEFISKLPNGYNTQVGEHGCLLSGGQKQRIAIARSIISKPKVLLLDEATSALDPEAEGIVQKALDTVSKGRTTIVIAHKLATIQKADNIIIQNLTAQSDESGDITDQSEPLDHVPMSIEPSRTLTRHETSHQSDVDGSKDLGGYDQHEQRGVISVIIRIVGQTPELRLAFIVILMACIVAGATFPGLAILIANIVEVFSLTGSEIELQGNFYAKMFIVFACGCFVAYFALGYATNVVAHNLSHKFRKSILESILRQDLQFFDREENTTGALISQIDSNPQAVLELMGYNVGLILVAVFSITACSVLAIVYSWRLGLVVTCSGLPPLVTAGYLKIRFDAKLDRETSRLLSLSASIASEAINSIRTVSSLAIENSVLSRYSDELDLALAGSKRPVLAMMICFVFTQSIEYWFMALGFWYGCYLLSFDQISIYAFFVAFLGVFFSGQSAAQLFQYSTSVTKGINAANYIFWLQDLQPSVRETDENRGNGPESGDTVNIRDVHFSYTLRPEMRILRGINVNIKKGQFVAFVGASGCGKSTIIALLERFYDPTTGSIDIDSTCLTSLNPRLYRRIVGLVQQEPALLQGSIRENMALGVDEPPDDTVSSSATGTDFVSSLPEGLSTPVGSHGTQLSGGQRQRIAIARTLIRDPKVLLLDEATSALDTESEKIIQDALFKATMDSKRITIAVAHRLSTIKDADTICVFHAGKIREVGTHQELIAQGGMYCKMCEAQALD